MIRAMTARAGLEWSADYVTTGSMNGGGVVEYQGIEDRTIY
jgi:hypothetical protein